MNDRSVYRTHASEDTTSLNERFRPLGYPACKFKYRPTFDFVQGLYRLSRASREVIAFCHLLFHGFYVWLKVNWRVCYEISLQVTYAFPPLFCLSIAPFKRLGRSAMSRRYPLCCFHSFTVWQTFNFQNNFDVIRPCELMMTFLIGSLWRHLCIVVLVLLNILQWWKKTVTGVGFEPRHPKILRP